MDADKENIPPQDGSMASIVANVHSTAKNAMGSQLDGSAKRAAMRSRGLRRDDPEKIKNLYIKFDSISLLLNLTDDVGNFLESISNDSSRNTTPNSHSVAWPKHGYRSPV